VIRRKALSWYLQARANAVPGKMLAPHFLPSGAPQKLGFDADRLERLHRGMNRFVETGRHAGVSLLLARDGRIADTFATGFRNREIDLPMTRDTIVRIYSMTKIIVSVAALTLLEEGKLGLLDPVTEYLRYSVDASRKERLAKVYEQGTDGELQPVQSLRGELVRSSRFGSQLASRTAREKCARSADPAAATRPRDRG